MTLMVILSHGQGGAKLITTKQLEELLQVSNRTILRWRSNGMPHYKINARTFRYDLNEVMEWIKNEKGGAASE